MARINPRSELIHARLLQRYEVLWWGNSEPPVIEPDITDRLHTVVEGDRIDNIAFRYYGDTRMKWTIMHLNNIYLIPNDLVPGMELRIPAFGRLTELGLVVS